MNYTPEKGSKDKTMEYEDVLKRLSPCGLDCVRCADYENGRIKELSGTLNELLGRYDRVARLTSAQDAIFKDYHAFSAILEQLSNGKCGGCRSDRVTCPITCQVKSCHKKKGVDF